MASRACKLVSLTGFLPVGVIVAVVVAAAVCWRATSGRCEFCTVMAQETVGRWRRGQAACVLFSCRPGPSRRAVSRPGDALGGTTVFVRGGSIVDEAHERRAG